MDLVILSRSPRLHSTRRLKLCALARGHTVRVIDPLRCSLVLRTSGLELLVAGRPVGAVDAVIPRLAPRTGRAGLAVLRQFELSGAWCLNGSDAFAAARDKLGALQRLARAGVPIVPTAFARHPDDVRAVLPALGGPPCVIKFVEGTQGVGVMLAESSTGAASIIDALHAVRRDLLLQQYIAVTGDARLIVVGEQVIAAMRRTPRAGDFRANLHRGGAAVALHPSQELCAVAIAACRALGMRCAGVDLLEGDAGPAILEVNASPGLAGIEANSGQNVALAIIKQLERERALAGSAPATR